MMIFSFGIYIMVKMKKNKEEEDRELWEWLEIAKWILEVSGK